MGTVSRYRYENADGSITWGYRNEDGSFKVRLLCSLVETLLDCLQEETIGTDCVTHGSYGYVDPTGSAREYSYTSGIRCDPHTRKVKIPTENNVVSKSPAENHSVAVKSLLELRKVRQNCATNPSWGMLRICCTCTMS